MGVPKKTHQVFFGYVPGCPNPEAHACMKAENHDVVPQVLLCSSCSSGHRLYAACIKVGQIPSTRSGPGNQNSCIKK